MNAHSLLAYYLSHMQIELFIAHHNTVSTEWRDLDFTPDYSKFYFIEHGSGWLKIGDEEYAPVPGQLILMPEGVPQSYSVIKGSDTYRKYWCHFSAKVGEINLFKLLDMPYLCTAVDQERVRTIFAELVLYANDQTVYARLLAKAKLLELFSLFVMQQGEESISLKKAAVTQRLTEILSYIQLNSGSDITIQDLAQRACLHPNYFIRMFKEQMGVPPIQYIARLKIEKAKELLADSSLSVSEVAEQTGFNDLFYFSKQFKKIAGVSPTEFRKQGS
ncbi:AraC family transcriptional regulator [Paenibacillus sp. KS-LC4]|uniref:AraC family transcriptional regulator n=1 Tax=Paenibacillus sp. KS-LC4 TaxID=2979727 RepID=UPI0030CCF0E9